MERIFNPDMLFVARNYRGMSQKELSRATHTSQGRISKIEAGVSTDITRSLVKRFSKALDFPEEWFYGVERFIPISFYNYH